MINKLHFTDGILFLVSLELLAKIIIYKQNLAFTIINQNYISGGANLVLVEQRLLPTMNMHTKLKISITVISKIISLSLLETFKFLYQRLISKSYQDFLSKYKIYRRKQLQSY